MTSPSFSFAPPIADVSSLPDRPSIMLSTSVPQERDPAIYEPADRARVAEINRNYVAIARPERIRAAVAAFTRVALLRGVRIVFGAHPSLSPTVLSIAVDMHAPEGSILVFQSDAYRDVIPLDTLRLANWSCGRLILIARRREASFVPTAAGALRRLFPYPASLLFMRQSMVNVPGLLGAVFIGGMIGVEEEAALFASRHPGLPRYAVSSTGSAAFRLAQQHPDAFHGRLIEARAFHATPSYTVAASMVLDDLLPAPPGHP